MTDDDLIEMWRFDATGRISPAVLDTYEWYLRRYVRDVGALSEATTFSLRRFMAANAERWAPATLAIVRRAFRSFFAQLPDNPAADIPPVHVDESEVRVADDDIRAALMAACCTVRDRAIVAVVCGSGARKGEVAALRLVDVDIERGTIRIVRSKTGHGRVAPLDPEARQALAAWLEFRCSTTTDVPAEQGLSRSLREKGSAGVRDINAANVPDTEALWLTKRGTPMTVAAVKTLLRRAAERAGVAWSPHDSRRAYATEWMRRGGSETGLMAACGWSSNRMVARYTRTHREELAVNEARRLFG